MMNANVLNMASIAHALLSFEPLGLADIQEAALLDRVDTKYVFAVNELPSLLAEMTAAYRVLTIDEARLHTYRTLYFDTDDFSIYEQHHNGFGSRYKVRARKYVGTDTAFFEIKHRTNQKRTMISRSVNKRRSFCRRIRHLMPNDSRRSCGTITSVSHW